MGGAQPLGRLPLRSLRNCPVTLFQLGILHAICPRFHNIISLSPGHNPPGRGCLLASRAPPRARGIFLRRGRKAPLLLLSVAASSPSLCAGPLHMLFLPPGTLPSLCHYPLGVLTFYFSHRSQPGHHLLLEAFPELKPCSLDGAPRTPASPTLAPPPSSSSSQLADTGSQGRQAVC